MLKSRHIALAFDLSNHISAFRTQSAVWKYCDIDSTMLHSLQISDKQYVQSDSAI